MAIVSIFFITNAVVDAKEIIIGAEKMLRINFSKEEAMLLSNYLDKDGDGQITYAEFSEKINFNDYQMRSQHYLISEHNFIERIMTEWYILAGEERQAIKAKIL